MKILPEKLEYPDGTYNISDIPGLIPDQNRAIYIPDGSVASLDMRGGNKVFWATQYYDPPRTDKGTLEFPNKIQTIYSQGVLQSAMFIACSAASLTVAQVPPKNDRLCSELKPILEINRGSYLGALLIRGSLSTNPDFLLRWLDDNHFDCDEADVETGNGHFAVVLDVESGIVSVPRNSPAREVVQYLPDLFDR